MIEQIKGLVRRHRTNIPGWKTGRKIVVIESDDWGSIRLPSASVLKNLEKMGIDSMKDVYLRYDALASETDLNELFHVLSSIKNGAGQSPVITANAIMANPDFKRIKEHGFTGYFYEPFTDTLQSYPEHGNSFQLWQRGMEEGYFHPQFHGREHLHVNRWMKGLQEWGSETAKAFRENLFAVCSGASSESRKSYMAAYELDSDADKEFTTEALREGLQMYEDIFGYTSLSAIAPNYTWNHDIEKVMCDNGVQFLQGGVVQRSPELGKNGNRLIRHHLGEKNDLGQIYLTRNCRFEPTSEPEKDWVASCLKEIEAAFLWRKPAIIESHRVNFIGYIDPENRERNLKKFEILLRKIVKRWPEVEFMTSDLLGNHIEESLKTDNILNR